MTEIILNIPDGKVAFFKKLAKELNLEITVREKPAKLSPAQKEWVDDLAAALSAAEQHSKGKIKLKTAQQLLDEL